MSDLDKDILDIEENIKNLTAKLANVENNIKNIDRLRTGESAKNYSNSGYEENLKRGNYDQVNDLTQEINSEKRKLDRLEQKKQKDSNTKNTSSDAKQSTEITESSSAGQVCEKCKYDGVKCLCHVTFKSLSTKDQYQWRGGNITAQLQKISPQQEHVFVGAMNKKNTGGSLQPYQLKFDIINSTCNGSTGYFSRCSKLYYYEESPKRHIVGKLIEEGQNGILTLKFNDAFLEKDTKETPYYLTGYKNKQKLTVYKKEDVDRTIVGLKAGELGTFGGAKVSFSLLNMDKSQYPFNLLRALDLAWRSTNFIFCSNYYRMPISAYHIAATECKDVDMGIIDQVPIVNTFLLKETYKKFDQAKIDAYVMPHYKTELVIQASIKESNVAQEYQNSEDSRLSSQNNSMELTDDMYDSALSDNAKDSFSVAKMKKNFQFSVGVKEYFNDKAGDEINLDLTEIWGSITSIKENFPHPIKFYLQAYKNTLDFFENFKENYATIERPQPNGDYYYNSAGYPVLKEKNIVIAKKPTTTLADEKLIRFQQFLFPSFQGKLTAELLNKNNELQITRSGDLQVKPIFGGKVSFNIALALIKAIPLLRETYEEARGLCNIFNSIDGVHTKVATTDVQSAAEKAALKDANVFAELLLVGQLHFSLTANTSFKIADSRLDEPPMMNVDQFNGNFTIDLEARASFKFKVFIIQGAFVAKVNVKTGLIVGYQHVVYQDAKGESQQENVWYAYFKGVDIIWSITFALGFVQKNKKNEWDTKDSKGKVNAEIKSGDGTTKPFVPVEGEKYTNQVSAEKRLDDLPNLEDQWRNEARKRATELKTDRDSGAIPWMDDKAITNLAKQHASQVAPTIDDDTSGEYRILKKHIELYSTHQTELNELASINHQLNNETNETLRLSLLKQRFDYLNSLSKMVNDSGLPLPLGSFYHDNLVTESKWRQEYGDYLNQENQKIAHLSGRNADVRRDELKNEREKMDNSNPEGGRAKLLGEYLLGADHLPLDEQNKLKQSLMKG